MGCVLMVVGFGLVVWDLLSIKPRWWGMYAWVLVLVGLIFMLLGI